MKAQKHPRVAQAIDGSLHTLVDHITVETTELTRGGVPDGLAVVLSIDGKINHSRRRARNYLVIPVELLGPLVTDLVVQAGAGDREFPSELSAAIDEGIYRTGRAAA